MKHKELDKTFPAGDFAARFLLGIVPLWSRILRWITFAGPTSFATVLPVKTRELTHPDIPVLKSYKSELGKDYWGKFPFRDLPTCPATKVNTAALETLLESRKGYLRNSEIARGKKALNFLTNGAPSYQKKNLPPISCKNSDSATEYGAALADTIADWIDAGFVAGPFVYPPIKNFRCNPVKMVPQHGKIRPVINMSSPIGYSFNDNIEESGLEKVTMSSAKKFGQSLLKAGVGARMSKSDMKNAYKIVPCNMTDLRLQGFQWGGRFFVETTQPFGAKSAVSNYDIVGNTVNVLALSFCKIPRELVHRQLDDVPSVGPKESGWCLEFTEAYEKVCKDLNIALAPECPKQDKAFTDKESGKVLGIIFNSEILSWTLPEEKRIEYLNDVHEAITQGHMSIQACQSLLGKLNFTCTMFQKMRTYKKPLQDYLSSMIESEVEDVNFPQEVHEDLLVWWSFLNDSVNWLPILPELEAPPLRHKTITTDAAGWKMQGGSMSKVGMGCIGLDEERKIFFASQKLWTTQNSRIFFDKDDKFLGNKTTTLEFAGILIPFLSCPEKLANQIVVIQVDNIGCHFAWLNGYASGDRMASILVRLLMLISSLISTEVIIVHHPRESSWESRMADRLTRERSTTSQDRMLLRSFPALKLPMVFERWMENPAENWSLAKDVVIEMSNSFSMPE